MFGLFLAIVTLCKNSEILIVSFSFWTHFGTCCVQKLRKKISTLFRYFLVQTISFQEAEVKVSKSKVKLHCKLFTSKIWLL